MTVVLWLATLGLLIYATFYIGGNDYETAVPGAVSPNPNLNSLRSFDVAQVETLHVLKLGQMLILWSLVLGKLAMASTILSTAMWLCRQFETTFGVAKNVQEINEGLAAFRQRYEDETHVHVPGPAVSRLPRQQHQ